MSNSEEFERATNAYKAAIELWKLGSDQVHNRLTAMLTANSIIVAITGLSIISKVEIPSTLIIALIAGGLTICIVWGFFVSHGVRVENYYRKKMEEFEKMAIPKGTQLLIRTHGWRFWGYGIGAYFTIGVFVGIDIALLVILLTRRV